MSGALVLDVEQLLQRAATAAAAPLLEKLAAVQAQLAYVQERIEAADDVLLDAAGAARVLGLPTARALRARIRRGGELGRSLIELRLHVDGAARWRRSDLLRLVGRAR